MSDVIFIAIVLAFFALAVLLVVGCDRIIGPDPAPSSAARDGGLEEHHP
jgi:hypothetical protein